MSKNAGKARALLEAALAGDVGELERLIGKNGNPDLAGADGRTALMNAAGGVQVDAMTISTEREASTADAARLLAAMVTS